MLCLFPRSPSSRVEGRRAGCRWRVSRSALSIAEWVHNSTMATFPAPATSNAACGFPALRFPARFMPRVMGPSMWPLLSSPFCHFLVFSSLYTIFIDTIRPPPLIPGARIASSKPPYAVAARVPAWPSWPLPGRRGRCLAPCVVLSPCRRRISRCATCAGGFVRRGTPWPQTTFYTCQRLQRQAPNPACALRRQVKREREQPPLSSGSRCEPVP